MAAFLHVDLVAASLISPGPEINYSNAMVIFFLFEVVCFVSRLYSSTYNAWEVFWYIFALNLFITLSCNPKMESI